ncbi:MAG: acetyl-CoA carboxylase biotin carboxylase subunit [Ignavibacteriae bacterium]|nr:acetyl-CoA carboxylase biotin carboxylase subunit [Ignavibacteria bacterium]MBI3363718.1 acetyl-CoA carboxylase biotin carboxylase subunit [Ignavibacteriota bacterium]
MFKKILIANRGEIALRIIRVCHELGVKTVAVYSEADKYSLHVRFADEAICIGPPAGRESYLHIPRIISAAEITNADAIHPGYGFLAENSQFAEICASQGLIFIGPSPDAITSMGDKSLAKDTMRKAGVPVVPGSDGVVKDVKAGLEIATGIGFPVMIKASAGGGGKGMRIVREAVEFEKAFQMASNEAGAAFGNADVYIEKFVEEPRHIEIQVFGDKFGNVVHLNERDCTVQRRHQKLIEESPSPIIDSDLREKMGAAAIKGAKSVKYEGAGTIEFLVDKEKNFYFMEMNTRIQVEHPVTEEVTGMDLIKLQLKMAAGERLRKKQFKPSGHALECRINAEDPEHDFRPSPGEITSFHLPGGYGVRTDTHCYAGYTVSPYYDSLIAKLIVVAPTRDEAIDKMSGALEEFTVEGIHTTIPFHRRVMKNETFRSGLYDTSFIEKHYNRD